MAWQPPREFYAEHLPAIKQYNIKDVHGRVSYHVAETFKACPRAAFYKNAVLIGCNALGREVKMNKHIYSATSADALGKALMAGFAAGSREVAIEKYHELIDGKETDPALEAEILNRLELLENCITSVLGAESIEPEYPIEWYDEKDGITYTGQADAVVSGKHGTFVVEVKNTNSPGWIKGYSGQVDYYRRLLIKTGMKIDGGFYLLFPGWFDRDGVMIHATKIDIHVADTDSATDYIRLLKYIVTIPLDEIAWPCSEKASINYQKCRTCQCRFDCEKELDKKLC